MLRVTATGEYLSQTLFTHPVIPEVIDPPLVVVWVALIPISVSPFPSAAGSIAEPLEIWVSPSPFSTSFAVDGGNSAEADPSPLPRNNSLDRRVPDDDSDSLALENVRLLMACVLVMVHVSVTDRCPPPAGCASDAAVEASPLPSFH